MLKSILKASVYMACLTWAGVACAAGLGGINVTSSLGQPLRAEIELVSVDKIDKSTLSVKLASADTFKNSGLDYPYNLPRLKFQVEDRANGDSFVKVTSAQSVNEPFVTLLVELTWSSGKLLREYTFLLDPADYKIEQPKAEEVKPIEPILAAPVVVPALEPAAEPAPVALAASEPAVAESMAQEPVAAEAAPAEVPIAETAVAAAPTEQASADQAPAEQTETQERSPAEAAPAAQDALSKEEAIAETTLSAPAEPVVVKRGDTLSKIAARIKPADVSLERMLVALYRENAGVFDAHNMNRIRAGKILNIPQSESVQMLPQADAEEEIRAQAADWNVYRQKLAAARATAAEHADKQEAAGKISTAVTDKASADKEPAKEVLKLSKGEAPGDKAVGGGKTTAQEKAIAKEEEAIAKNKALKEAQERTAILEKNVKDMQRLAELKKETAASTPAGAVTLAGSTPQAASSVVVAKPKVAEPKVVEQPSLVDQLLADPMHLAGGAAVLLLLGGAGFMVARRNKQGGPKKETKSKKQEEVGASTGRIAAPIAPSPDTGDFTAAAAPSAVTAASPSTDAEEVDPIGEADLFLTFGRDAQAEEVLKEALKKSPNNIPVKLKLLSIYANRKDGNSFLGYAREIKESGDETAWGQAASMGRELEPSNPFYGGSSDTPDTTGNRSAQAAAAPAVDFDLGFGATTPAQTGFSSQNTVVLETQSQEKTTTLTSEDLRAAVQSSTPMDFDITGTNPGTLSANSNTEQTAVLNMDDLVFDVTATHPKVPFTEATPAAPADDGMTFTLDFPMEIKDAPAPKASASVPDIGFGGISLDLDGLNAPAAAGAAGSKDENWHEVATKLDLAKAYQEMGDAAGAKEILDEVLRDGDDQQKETAQTLLQQL
ncbi:MAG: LysM peptidoglycan-binding domain-containing protein [Nitrosomonadales bacterium]|nr:LysM peptidoglycan-binding domain-containing protein [Nitrosomonadales bacterium]